MAFKSTITNFQNSWKAPNAYNTSYREKEGGQILNKATLSHAMDTSLQTTESEFITQKDNFYKTINTSLSKESENSIKEKLRYPTGLEIDTSRYKKHDRDDSFSDSSLQLHSSDNSISATSTCLTTPVDNLDSKFDYMKAGLSHEEIQAFTAKQQQQHKEELEQLRKEHKIQLDKKKLDYEKLKNDQKQEFEKIIQELKNDMKEENKLEMEKLRKNLRQYKENEEKIKNELTSLHDTEKNKIIESMKRLKEKVEDELTKSKNNFRVEKRSIMQEYEKKIEILRNEHAGQLDSMKRGETKVTFMQIKNQQERMKKEGERELQNQIKELTRELNEKEASEASLIKYIREKESALLDLKTRLKTANKQKEDQIVELQEENTLLSQEIEDLNRNKGSTNKMLKEFRQKTEEAIKNLKRQLDDKTKAERESEQLVETLREQLNDTNEDLSSLQIQLSSSKLEFIEAKEYCEDLKSQIEKLQLQLEHKKAESKELESRDTQNFKEFKEQQEKEREQAIALLRTKLESGHQKELQELRNQLEKEYGIKIRELVDQNSRLKQDSVQLNTNAEKYQQFVHKNQQLSNENVAFRSKVEELETNNLDLKENNRLITSEKEKVAEELKKVKDEIRRLRDESSTISNKMIELENERDRLAGTASTVKTYWEKNYKDLQIQFQEMESQRDKLDNELTKIKSDHNKKMKTFEELTSNMEIVEKQKETISKLLEEHQNGMQTFMKENAVEREAWIQKEADLVSNYELELREKDSELEEFRSKLDHEKKYSEELEQLLQESQEVKSKQLELSQKLETALQECENKDNEISNLEMFKKQSQARIDSLESLSNRLTAKLRAFETDAEQGKRNADAKISDLQNRLSDSMMEIEELHNQVSDLKQKLIEKEAIVLSHSRSSSRDGSILDTSKLTYLTKQVEEYKVTHQNLKAQIATLTQKLQEKNSIMTTLEHSITQAEKAVEVLHNKIETMKIEHEEEKKQIFSDHQLSIHVLKKQQEDEIAKISEITQSRLTALEERQRNNHGDAKKVNVLEQRLSELENSLKESLSECDKLNEKIMHVQQRYADSISEKDKVTKERNDIKKRVNSLEGELNEVLKKNMDLVMKMSNLK